MVVVNRTEISLNLMFWHVTAVNAGVALLASFMIGSLLGLIVGLNLYVYFKLQGQVWWLKRQTQQLRSLLAEKQT